MPPVPPLCIMVGRRAAALRRAACLQSLRESSRTRLAWLASGSAPAAAASTLARSDPALGVTQETNMCNAINSGMRIAMETDERTCVFGEDVGFGGVFRCTVGLQDSFGKSRVFNTPLCEQGIVGFAIGMAAQGWSPIAEIQFADYIFPAFDQITNEAAKMRFRSGGMFDSGGLTIRTPYGAVGHGGLYHSQSPESYFTQTPGLKVVVPRDPFTAKGLLIASIRDKNPVVRTYSQPCNECLPAPDVIRALRPGCKFLSAVANMLSQVFLEPKMLYRSSVCEVPVGDYEIPLSKADIVQEGSDVTVVGWGAQMRVLAEACDAVAESDGISCELIDLQTLLPWDTETVEASVNKTGRLLISHEAPVTGGFGAEIAARVTDKCFLSLEAPVKRVCGYDTPFPLVHEAYYVPSVLRCTEGIRELMEF